MGNIALRTKSFKHLEKLVQEIKQTFTLSNGDIDKSCEGLLEVYALEIQLCQEINDTKRLRMIYPETLELSATIKDPAVMGIIKECGGKMHMVEKQWKKALDELYESFKCYQEVGRSD